MIPGLKQWCFQEFGGDFFWANYRDQPAEVGHPKRWWLSGNAMESPQNALKVEVSIGIIGICPDFLVWIFDNCDDEVIWKGVFQDFMLENVHVGELFHWVKIPKTPKNCIILEHLHFFQQKRVNDLGLTFDPCQTLLPWSPKPFPWPVLFERMRQTPKIQNSYVGYCRSRQLQACHLHYRNSWKHYVSRPLRVWMVKNDKLKDSFLWIMCCFFFERTHFERKTERKTWASPFFDGLMARTRTLTWYFVLSGKSGWIPRSMKD